MNVIYQKTKDCISYFSRKFKNAINHWKPNKIVIFMRVTVLATIIMTSCKTTSSTEEARSIPFEVGAAMVEITLPIGFPHYRGESTGIASPLYAKTLVFKQGDTHGAIVVCDLISITRGLSRIVREKACKQTDIPFENISITATHTHTGPSYGKQMHEYSDREASGKLTEEDKSGYLSTLIERIIITPKS